MLKKFLFLSLCIMLSACSKQEKTITMSEAESIAVSQVSGEVIKAEKESDLYAFEISQEDSIYIIHIDNKTGEIVKKVKTTSPDPVTPVTPEVTLSMEEAQQIAIDRIGQGVITKCELDQDYNIIKYEVEIIYNNKEYEVDINANTGEIIKVKEEIVD